MEVEEIQSQTQACKFSRIGNGRLDSTKMSRKDQYPDDEEDGEQKQQLQLIKRASVNDSGGALAVNNNTADGGGGGNKLRSWHHSSRIIRVSRASGGKDRHSKVWTSKGLRDRRVRLSVTTAIQFYDLQDRLGCDQPSKAVEWLIKAAADSIAELPSLNSSFPDTPKQLSDEKRASEGTTDQQGFDSVELDGDPNNNYQQNQSQHRSLSKSACSSNSETSKGSGLSLSRCELRVNRDKARERARERAAKEKDHKENESQINANRHHHHNVNPISQSSSFTELLTGGIGGSVNNNNNTSPTTGSSQQQNEESNFFHKATTAAVRPWPPMDYFNSGLLGPSSSRPPHHHFSGQIQLGSSNSLPQAMPIPPFSVTNENHHQEMQHFSFVPDHLIPVTATQPGPGGGDYLISSSLGFNRGTLQSNSSLFPHIQRFGSSSPIDGSNVNVPFLIGTAPPVENHNHHHHQFPAGFDGRLHLYYGDGSRHSDSDQKDKGKN